jgi:hypothetical protein
MRGRERQQFAHALIVASGDPERLHASGSKRFEDGIDAVNDH